MQRQSAQSIHARVKEISDCVKGLSSPPRFAPCNMATIVRNVLQIVDLMAQEKAISLRTEGLDDLPPIMADEQRLYNALYNLINNAIAEVPPSGVITIRAKADPQNDFLYLTVTDTGRGMPPEVRESLFTSRSISRKPGGTGLGTKIIKDVVDAHNGKISVESREGVGTSFHLVLPLNQPVTAPNTPSRKG